MVKLEEGVFLINGEELTKRLREKYDQGYADGYNKAIAKLSGKGNSNELDIGEQVKEWGDSLDD
jgi:hypothetical protein